MNFLRKWLFFYKIKRALKPFSPEEKARILTSVMIEFAVEEEIREILREKIL